MNTCKTCKWWRRGGYFERFAIGYEGEIVRTVDEDKFWGPHCVAVVTDEDSQHGHCLHPSIQSDFSLDWTKRGNRNPVDGVFATCDEDRGCLHVGQDFGCIHHEPKE